MIHEWVIGILTPAAICCLALGHPAGNVFGLLASPSWLITTWRAPEREWGKFAVGVLCALFYLTGLVRWLLFAE